MSHPSLIMVIFIVMKHLQNFMIWFDEMIESFSFEMACDVLIAFYYLSIWKTVCVNEVIEVWRYILTPWRRSSKMN